ncbi:MAG: hypothetical protein ACTXOO_00260 [Sodalis sp. (in: enterobacteria)]
MAGGTRGVKYMAEKTRRRRKIAVLSTVLAALCRPAYRDGVY